MKQLIFGILFVLLFNSIWSLEEYSEELHISSLPNNDLSYLFRFITTASGNGNAQTKDSFRLFPMTIKQLFDYDIEEFQLSMTTGFWKHDVWGIQPKTDSPTGFLLLVKFSDNMTDETVSKTWSLIVKQINGFFCSSILEMDPVLTVIPTFVDGNAKNYRFAHLSGEPLCTENIKPFLRLLPCKTSGLGTLIFSNDFFNTPFHSLSIHATKQQDDFNVELVAQIVKSKLSLLKYGGQFAQLTSLTDNLKCSVAKEQKLTHNFGTNYEASIDDQKFMTFDLTTMNTTNKTSKLKILMDRKELEKRVIYSPPLSLTIAQEQSDFRGGIMTTTIFNNLNEDLIASYFHVIPWQFRIEIDSLNFQCKQDDKSFQNFPFLKKSLDPALMEKKALAFEIGLTLPKHSLCTLKLKFSNYLMIALSYPPDSNYGIFVPSPILTVNVTNDVFTKHSINLKTKKQNEKEEIRIFGEPLLILLPVPDFSMPFNVIVIATTVAGYFFGSIYNINIKAYLPKFK